MRTQRQQRDGGGGRGAAHDGELLLPVGRRTGAVRRRVVLPGRPRRGAAGTCRSPAPRLDFFDAEAAAEKDLVAGLIPAAAGTETAASIGLTGVPPPPAAGGTPGGGGRWTAGHSI